MKWMPTLLFTSLATLVACAPGGDESSSPAPGDPATSESPPTAAGDPQPEDLPPDTGDMPPAETETGGEKSSVATLRVLLTDAPGDFEAVPVTIDAVEAFLTDAAADPTSGSGGAPGDDEGDGAGAANGGPGGPSLATPIEPGWQTLIDAPAVYDLLQLQNGITAALGNAEIPAGSYSQIRLIVSSAEVVIDGEHHELKIPSGENTGLKLNFDFAMEGAETYDLVLDFDAQESVKKAGPNYLLTPVIKVLSFGPAQ